jgi:hypothetical protein
MFAPCFEWISDQSGRIIVDYVARIESLGEQWPIIQERTGRTMPLPVRNASKGDLGWDALDLKTRLIIQERFRKDFDELGYEP